MSNIAMNKPIDYEEKRKRKILSNGKHDVSVYQGGPFTVVPRRALNDKRICKHPQTYLVLSVLCSLADKGTKVFIGDAQRFYLPKNNLESVVKYSPPFLSPLEDTDLKNAQVWRVL